MANGNGDPELTLDQLLNALGDRELLQLATTLREVRNPSPLSPSIDQVLEDMGEDRPVIRRLLEGVKKTPEFADPLFEKVTSQMNRVGIGEGSKVPRANSLSGRNMGRRTNQLQGLIEHLFRGGRPAGSRRGQ